MIETTESELVAAHLPCPVCGSHDAYATYSDGHGFCHSCQAFVKGTGETLKGVSRMAEELTTKGSHVDLSDRGITKETCKKYDVRAVRIAGEIAQHIYPYCNQEGTVIKQKIRTVASKEFKWIGDSKDSIQLFGADKFPAGGKIITVCEGEVDAMSAYQMLGSRHPVVSISAGAGSIKDIKKNYEYLDKFEKIYLCWDNDEAGREGLDKVLKFLPMQKVYIIKLPTDYKDANDMLKAGKSSEFVNYFWRAEQYRPNDITNFADTFDRLADFHKERAFFPTGWAGVDKMTSGFRPSQFVVIAAGTGMGKSAILRDFIHYQLTHTEFKIGSFFLEEVLEDTVLSLLSMEVGRNLKRPEVWNEIDKGLVKKAFDKLAEGNRLELFEGFTFDATENLEKKIQYLTTVKGCTIIIIDHLTFLVDDSDNVRQELNALCKKLKELAVDLNITIIAPCHLRKASTSQTHEEGARVTLDDLKDSSSVKQLADIVIGLERNSQETQEILQNTTVLRVLKNRDFGDRGEACALYYDKDTTQFEEIPIEQYHSQLDMKEEI